MTYHNITYYRDHCLTFLWLVYLLSQGLSRTLEYLSRNRVRYVLTAASFLSPSLTTCTGGAPPRRWSITSLWAGRSSAWGRIPVTVVDENKVNSAGAKSAKNQRVSLMTVAGDFDDYKRTILLIIISLYTLLCKKQRTIIMRTAMIWPVERARLVFYIIFCFTRSKHVVKYI